jgi:hypothetical protein
MTGFSTCFTLCQTRWSQLAEEKRSFLAFLLGEDNKIFGIEGIKGNQ